MGQPSGEIVLGQVRMPARNIFLVAVVTILLTSSTCVAPFTGSPNGTKKSSGPSQAWVPSSMKVTPFVSSQAIDVFRAYSTEPAPMGIADYGVGLAGPYQYSTNAFLGSVYIGSLQTRNATGDPSMGLQLNIVLSFTDGNVQYAYWVQDIAQIDTSTNQIFFIDNIWNFTSHSANMIASAVSGNGQVSYSFGSTSGTVRSGTTVVVFAPAGSVVVLKASPSSILYAFSGWSQGNVGTGSTTSLTLMSPSIADASFALNIPLLSGIVAVVLVVVLVSAFALRSRRRALSGDQFLVPKGVSS
ncbi:MAG TPA: thermopsin family protease [Nitrososphaerales archaeon]|nr:thermopsin family protease [Nitrososphaerales archaeon]